MDIQLLKWQQAEEIALPIRTEIFVNEQSVPLDLELDEYDIEATHALLWVDGLTVGTGRVFKKEITSNVFFIGRLCVLKRYRGLGYGEYLMKTLIQHARQQGATECCIHAQSISQLFYKKLGFIAHPEIFMEAGIEHVLMTLTVPQ
ncbi:acetyltransferase [Polynucleobacter sp. SHI8]|uniref:GNAT family N-acetyltransferase n=1 Tax=unclassified Polynucleobacter TaxID=2640945 RepID=UPI00248F563F|nr:MULTISPECIES: GNAT family N-acetyltransferase [unclassified Polynucleobacter]BDW11056.1 acetyltransferase [Polynucleobacter sp. SHI2]BDW13502.1 acetyltransferase [Polynucleobacter sp. SHI8]